ncbi:MAG: hypothetical protein BGO98_21745 [Myxococcales bacterium 68-20]|nr:hypothetical protein [Myxococcales bacterium]OJY28169.1 MAG: hypothetical protein BGO98_21745 [Myxococcales bacterium 68-20]
MPTPFAAGENYAIELDGEHVVGRVWRRPDLDSASGARSADEMAAHLRSLTTEKRKSLLLDLRDAPAIAGPRTVETLSDLLRGCEKAGVRIAVILSGDAMQLLQFRRLVSTFAPSAGRAAVTLAEGEQWLSAGIRGK